MSYLIALFLNVAINAVHRSVQLTVEEPRNVAMLKATRAQKTCLEITRKAICCVLVTLGRHRRKDESTRGNLFLPLPRSHEAC